MKIKLLLNHYVVGFDGPDVASNIIEVDAHTLEMDGLKFTPEAILALGDNPDAIYRFERGPESFIVKVINREPEETN